MVSERSTFEARETLRRQLAGYLSASWNEGTEVTQLARIPGGASRETWRFVATSKLRQRSMVVRIDPETSLIDTDRKIEFRAMQAAFKAGIPTPEPLLLAENPSWLGRPFSISAEVTGCKASPDTIPNEHRSAIGRQKWQLLGRIARLDPTALGLADVMPRTTPETCALEQLDYWRHVIEEDELHPNPITHAALRWLHRHLPPRPARLCLVHGDYRTGNFLYTPDGEIKAILDWEMAHIGDPLEDLAWSLDPLWCWQHSALAGRLLPHREAIRQWASSSGLTFDPEAFKWWRVFASFKGMAIWTSSSRDFHSGSSRAPILAYAGWLMSDRQQQILLDYLSPHSTQRYGRGLK